MPHWRQQAGHAQLPRKDRMGGAGSLPYNTAHQWEIRLTERPQDLLFIDKGSYPAYGDPEIKVPFWEKARHQFADNRGGKRYFRSFLCPKGKDRSVACRACTMQYDESDPRISTRRIKYFPVISLEWWYKTVNKYGDENYILPQTPAEKRRLEAEGAQPVFGRLGYLALGNGHFSQLMDIVDTIAGQCINCLEPNSRPSKLFPASYSCGACETVLADLETTDLSGDDLKSFPYRKHKCPMCGNHDLPTVNYECEKCDDPHPAEIFDVVIPLAKRGENTSSTVMVPPGEDITFIDNTDLGDDLGVLFDGEDFNPIIAPMYKALDFEKIFEVEMRPDYQDVRVF